MGSFGNDVTLAKVSLSFGQDFSATWRKTHCLREILQVIQKIILVLYSIDNILQYSSYHDFYSDVTGLEPVSEIPNTKLSQTITTTIKEQLIYLLHLIHLLGNRL